MNSTTCFVPTLTRQFPFPSIISLAILAVFVVAAATAHAARDVTFIWNANPEAVDGYRLYYKTGSSGPPYNGSGALEGASPVAVGNLTTFTLHGLSDTATYYFTLTAYQGADESGYAAEIILPPVPAVNTLPTASGASYTTTENSPVSGQLNASDPDGDPLTYRVISNGSLGTAVITNASTGAFTYTPFAGATGSDAFSFRANDGSGDSNTATVLVLVEAVNEPPAAVIEPSANSGEAPLQVVFDGTASLDSDGTITRYSWDFGDGQTATGAVVSHSYQAGGVYTVRLTVTDNNSQTSSATTPILVSEAGNEPPLPVLSASPGTGVVPLPVVFSAAGSSDPDGWITSYRWDFDDGTTASGPAVNHIFSTAGVYTVTLRVTDNQGVTSRISRLITVQTPRSAAGEEFPWNLFLPVITGGIQRTASGAGVQ